MQIYDATVQCHQRIHFHAEHQDKTRHLPSIDEAFFPNASHNLSPSGKVRREISASHIKFTRENNETMPFYYSA